jgi:hypothetical protein
MLFLCSSCSTRISVNTKRVKYNNRFQYGLTIQQITVSRFDKDGVPLDYQSAAAFRATNLQLLDDGEIAAFLKAGYRTKFLALKARKDSFDKANVLEYRPADTLVLQSGTRSYLPAGLKRPVIYTLMEIEMEELAGTIPVKAKRKIRFSRPNKFYRWYLPGKNQSQTTLPPFETGQWYCFTVDCNFGLLASGWCTVFFMAGKNGKLTVRRRDKMNEGPF